MAIYRLPFPAESDSSTWGPVRGGWDENGHPSFQGVENTTDEQAYAWDLKHATGGKILAARAGMVIYTENAIPDDTNPPNDPVTGSGNFVWIRHADGTMAAYLHMQCGSVRVVEGQWVPQGFWIGQSGNTGSSDAPHLHFDVHSYGEKGPPIVLGVQLIHHFEDKTRSSFRLAAKEFLSSKSNNRDGDYRQDHWRHCMKCNALFFAGSPGSRCPADNGEHYYEGGNYTLSVDSNDDAFGQPGWRYCRACKALFFKDVATTVCPANASGHDGSDSGAYRIRQDEPDDGQGGWRWCAKCSTLWFEAEGSRCPADNGPHTTRDSGYYWLHHSTDDWQQNWRWCGKCGGLFFATRIAQSRCAGNGGGPHIVGTSTGYNYILPMNAEVNELYQAGWRWCNKCQGLWSGLDMISVCPADNGPHEKGLSADYALIHNAESTGPGERGWRWCRKCQGIWWGDPAGRSGNACPGGQSHINLGSGYYRIQFDSH